MTSVLASPMLARCESSLTASMNFGPPPAALDAEAQDGAEAAVAGTSCASSWSGCDGRPGIVHPAHQRMASRNWATAGRSRSGAPCAACSVSSPCRKRKALNGRQRGAEVAQQCMRAA